MRLSSERIKSLQALLKELFGLEYTDEQVQQAGLAIMRFAAMKAQRERKLKKEGEIYGQVRRDNGTTAQ